MSIQNGNKTTAVDKPSPGAHNVKIMKVLV